MQKWSGPTDLETSKLDGGYADHNNKIRVAECARDWACDPLRIAANRKGLDLRCHCIYQTRRQVGRCRSLERGVSVGDRAVAGLASRHRAAPGANCADPSNAGVQDRLVARSPVATNQPSKITAKGSSLSTRPTATGTDQRLARILPHLRPAPRSIASHRCKAPPGHARSGDTLAWRLALYVCSQACTRGSIYSVSSGLFWKSGEGGKW